MQGCRTWEYLQACYLVQMHAADYPLCFITWSWWEWHLFSTNGRLGLDWIIEVTIWKVPGDLQLITTFPMKILVELDRQMAYSNFFRVTQDKMVRQKIWFCETLGDIAQGNVYSILTFPAWPCIGKQVVLCAGVLHYNVEWVNLISWQGFE